MDKSQIKEELSINYIATVAAMGGIDYEIVRHDGDSTDGVLKKWVIPASGAKIHTSLRVQLKCTSSLSQYSDDGKHISYQLKAKNYNDLTAKATTPIVLGLLVLPEKEDDWVKWSTDELLIRGCMYWLNLAKCADTNNTASVSVKIDKNNVINSNTLNGLLNKIAEKGEL